MNSNPIFADTYFRLAPISPCVDAGNNSAVTVPEDYDGTQRIFDGDGDMNPVVDMGAFEYGSGAVVGVPGESSPGAGISLRAWPNPARASTHISFELSRPGRARLDVFDLSGKSVLTLMDRDLDSRRACGCLERAQSPRSNDRGGRLLSAADLTRGGRAPTNPAAPLNPSTNPSATE